MKLDLNSEELEILNNYRSLSEFNKGYVLQCIESRVQEEYKKKSEEYKCKLENHNIQIIK